MTIEEHAETCGARTRAAGGRACGLRAGWGTSHPGHGRCRLHGGSTPNHEIAAESKMAARALEQLGLPIPSDPAAALQRAVDSAAGLHYGLEQLVREAATAGDSGSKALSARLSLYADAVDRLARVARSAVDARLGERIAERQAVLDEKTARLFVEAVRAAYITAGLPAAMRETFERAVGRNLRQIGSSDTTPTLT